MKQICNVCGAKIEEGFVVETIFENEYYCSEECRRKKYTDEQYQDKFERDEACWTYWYDE